MWIEKWLWPMEMGDLPLTLFQVKSFIANTAVWLYRKAVNRVNSMNYHKEKKGFPFLFLFYWCEKMDISWTYCENHFTIYVNPSIMLCTLNLHSDVHWLFLRKTGKKIMVKWVSGIKLISKKIIQTLHILSNPWIKQMSFWFNQGWE